MPEKAWKRAERSTARKLGGERNPLSGSNSRHTSGDGIQMLEYLEHKRRDADPVWDALDEITPLARRRDRWPKIVYEHQDPHEGPCVWVALWLRRYLSLKNGDDHVPRIGKDAADPWLVQHRVSQRLPHASLVRETVRKAREEGKPPLVVISVHGSPRKVCLLPVPEEV